MIDQLASAETCRVCGAVINKDEVRADGTCSHCAESTAPDLYEVPSVEVPAAEFDPNPISQRDTPPDPDRPTWGPVSGIVVWLMSVAALFVVPAVAVVIWYLIQSARGVPLPNLSVEKELREWLTSPDLLLVQVLSTIVAHAVTIAICWAVVTGNGKRPFWESLGWNWAGRPVWYWLVASACIIVGLLIASQLLARVLPQSEDNAFADLLKSSRAVRIAIAVLATFTAPLVEEAVYRGVLFSGLRRGIGLTSTVLIVTVMFAGVHVLQYSGAWVSIAGLVLLSLTLTIMRAKTKSILPCVLVHTLNNAFFSVFILLNKS